jgi:anti-sigma factor RsiW
MCDDNDPFEDRRREQLRRWAETTPAERLAWLWQAKLFAARALGAVKRAGDGAGVVGESASGAHGESR